jgi:hypothetical protein
MATEEASTRRALATLLTMTEPGSRPKLAAATAALGRFKELNAQIIALSRRNTNLRSLAPALGQKRTRTTASEDRLHALQDALTNRDFRATR